MKKTLLQVAKGIKHERRSRHMFTKQDRDLVYAWLTGEISATQMCKATKQRVSGGNYMYYCASVIRHFILMGEWKIVRR